MYVTNDTREPHCGRKFLINKNDQQNTINRYQWNKNEIDVNEKIGKK